MALPISKDYLLTQLRNFKSVILDPAYTIQKTSLPTASSANEGAIFQYIGSASGMTVGGFYQCQEVTPATDPKTYHWVEVTTKTAVDDDTIHADADGVLSVDSKFKKIYTGHKADWEALPTAEKVKYDEAHFDDDIDSIMPSFVGTVELVVESYVTTGSTSLSFTVPFKVALENITTLSAVGRHVEGGYIDSATQDSVNLLSSAYSLSVVSSSDYCTTFTCVKSSGFKKGNTSDNVLNNTPISLRLRMVAI